MLFPFYLLLILPYVRCLFFSFRSSNLLLCSPPVSRFLTLSTLFAPARAFSSPLLRAAIPQFLRVYPHDDAAQSDTRQMKGVVIQAQVSAHFPTHFNPFRLCRILSS